MLSSHAALGIASLIVTMVLSAPELAAQSPARGPYKRAMQKQSQSHSQTQAPADQVEVEVINGSSRTMQDLDAQRPSVAAPGGSAAGLNTVDVINGFSRRTQIFNAEQSPEAHSGQSVHRNAAKRRTQKREATELSQLSNVEIINGARLETRSFAGSEDEPPLPERQRRRLQRVVVGFESADSARKRGNTKPVVTAIATSESERLRGNKSPVVVAVASSEAKSDVNTLPGQYWIAPQAPKRPPYHPDPPSPQ